jgi:uncharacterized protein (DUF486 family)
MKTIILLLCSNMFMTYAWYGHLKDLRERPIWIAILASWGVAFFEYCLQVPANRAGFGSMSLAQLKVLQEVITMLVFVAFAHFYMKKSVNLDFLWASLCMLGAVYFIFRRMTPAL